MQKFHATASTAIILLAVLLFGGYALYDFYQDQQLRARITALEAGVGGTAPPAERLETAVAAALPAVVSIVISRDMPLVEVEYVNPFPGRDIGVRVPVYRFRGTELQEVGAGSGFIVSDDGLIVTNRHVVSDPEATYMVLLANGEEREATVRYRDPEDDLALLDIAGGGYEVLPLGETAELALGQTVAAIGNALGEYANTVSIGIISGLDRTIVAGIPGEGVEELAGLIQTDAAINRGNSGGPLINLEGAAVGVNVAVQRGATGIGFAVPVSEVREMLSQSGVL